MKDNCDRTARGVAAAIQRYKLAEAYLLNLAAHAENLMEKPPGQGRLLEDRVAEAAETIEAVLDAVAIERDELYEALREITLCLCLGDFSCSVAWAAAPEPKNPDNAPAYPCPAHIAMSVLRKERTQHGADPSREQTPSAGQRQREGTGEAG